MGGRIYPGDTPAHERVVAGLIEALGHEEYDRWHAAGATLSFDESVELALGRDPAPPANGPSAGTPTAQPA